MFAQSVSHEDSGVFHVNTICKFGVATTAHQQIVISRHAVEILITNRRAVFEPSGYKSFPFGSGHIKLHTNAAQTHDRSTQYLFDLSTAKPHGDKCVLRRQNFKKCPAGNWAFP